MQYRNWDNYSSGHVRVVENLDGSPQSTLHTRSFIKRLISPWISRWNKNTSPCIFHSAQYAFILQSIVLYHFLDKCFIEPILHFRQEFGISHYQKAQVAWVIKGSSLSPKAQVAHVIKYNISIIGLWTFMVSWTHRDYKHLRKVEFSW